MIDKLKYKKIDWSKLPSLSECHGDITEDGKLFPYFFDFECIGEGNDAKRTLTIYTTNGERIVSKETSQL